VAKKSWKLFSSKFDHSLKRERERKYCEIILFYFYIFILTKFSTKKEKTICTLDLKIKKIILKKSHSLRVFQNTKELASIFLIF
jgi:hypothetical protein